MNKRYQVFVSSTYEDLKEERKEIIEMLLMAKYFPAGMEMFSASNEDQFKYIKKIIDDCDYYVLVLGARYGSINNISGKSFTEMEYDYALEKGIPILAFVHANPDNMSSDKRERENIELFENFRNKVLSNSKMCRMWSQCSDLVSSIVVSLTEILDECPRKGWSRGEQDATELLSQINALRIENEDLKLQNKELLNNKKEQQIDIMKLSQGDDEFEIYGKNYKESVQVYDEYFDIYDIEWRNDVEFVGMITWNAIFQYIAPEIFSRSEESYFRSLINQFCTEYFGLEHFEISRKSYNVIKFQMVALNWISLHEYGDGYVVQLTELGRKNFMENITLKR